MRKKLTIKLLSIFVAAILLTACGGGHRADYTEQTCEARGPLFWIKLVSFDAAARKDAVLADDRSADIVERASAIVGPTALNLVFSRQGISFYGFTANDFFVSYKNVTYLRIAEGTGNQDALVIDYIGEDLRDGADRQASQESVTGLSSSCKTGLQEYLATQGVALAG